MMRHFAKWLLIVGAVLPAALPADGRGIPEGTQSLYVFTGRYTTETTSDSAIPFQAEYEHSYALGGAYGRDVYEPGWGAVLGWELGGALRAGDRWSGEIWAGPTLRHRGVSIFGIALLKPSVTVGLSVVDRSIGEERDREARHDRDATLLYYFGPELAVALPRHPQWELVYRLHHRSGGNRTLGNMGEGHNANTLGLRWRF